MQLHTCLNAMKGMPLVPVYTCAHVREVTSQRSSRYNCLIDTILYLSLTLALVIDIISVTDALECDMHAHT